MLDFKYECFRYTVRNIAKIAFGLDDQEHANNYFFSVAFLNDLQTIFHLAIEIILFPLPRWMWKYSPWYKYELAVHKANERFDEACLELLRLRRQVHSASISANNKKSTTLIDVLLQQDASDLEPATFERMLLENMKTFFAAGTETASTVLSQFAKFVTNDSALLAKLRVEADVFFKNHGEHLKDLSFDEIIGNLPLAVAVSKEILRVDGIASFIVLAPDTNGEDVTLPNGLLVHGKDEIFAYYEGLHWDSDTFQDAKVFRPERWLLPNDATEEQIQNLKKMEECFFGFGYGPRICPGMNLGYLELCLSIAGLVHRFDMKLACSRDEIKTLLLFVNTPNKMPVILSKR